MSPAALRTRLAGVLAAQAVAGTLRVLLDGSPPTAPDRLADDLAGLLPGLGRPVLRVSATDFLRPAGVRLEHGRTDPDALYELAVDRRALVREVLDPLGPGGAGTWLPTLWDAATDRATRVAGRAAPDRAVLLLDGALLAGRGLPVDVTVHLHLPPDGLARALPADQHWCLPAYARHEATDAPDDTADLVVLLRHPDRPAVVDRLGLL